GNALLGLRFLADQPEQAVDAIEFRQLVAMVEEADALLRRRPLVVDAGLFEEGGRQLDDQLLAIIRIGQVHRIVRVDQQQLTRHEIMLFAAPTPQAMAALQQLQVVDGFQRRRGDMHAAAITEPAEVELAELAVAEAGLGMASAWQLDAVRT